MADLTFSAEFEDQIRAAMMVPDPSPGFLNDLRQQLIAQSKKTNSRRIGFFQRPALRWGLAVFAAVLVAILLIGPQRVASAFQRLLGLGYIPGIGIVDQAAPLRVLEEPVAQTREGIKVTVEQVILDSERTVLLYRVDGIPMSSFPKGEMDFGCRQVPYLRLMDGTLLEPDAGGGMKGWDSGYQERYVYPPLPADIDEAVLLIHCLSGTAANAAPVNWEIPLKFVPAPPEMTVFPVIDLLPSATAAPQSTSTPQAMPTEAGTTPPETSSPSLVPGQIEHAVQLSLDRIVQLDDGYALYATFVWNDDTYIYALPDMIRLFDANGNQIPTEMLPPETEVSIGPPYHFPIVIKSLWPITPGPLTISVGEVEGGIWLAEAVRFSFDAGPDPQIGQEWTLDQQIDIDGHEITIQSVRAVRNLGQPGYEFVILTDGEISAVTLTDEVNPVTTVSGNRTMNSFVQQVQYEDQLPTGTITFLIQRYDIQLPGSWQATWTLSDDMQIAATSLQQATWRPSDPLVEIEPTPTPEIPEETHLSLDRVALLDDGYVFYATFYWYDDIYTFIWPYRYSLLDANGKEIPTEDLSGETDDSSVPHRYPIALKARAPLPPGPVTISVDEVDISLPVEASFSFDAGIDPQIGQEWTLDQEIQVAGYTLTIQSVRAVMDREYPSYEFEILAEDDVFYVGLMDPVNPLAGGSGSGGESGPIYARIHYPNGLPAGSVIISITELNLLLPGPWQAIWAPSEDLQVTATSQEQAACLTYKTWQQFQMQAPLIPSDLGGKLLRFGPVGENQEDWMISTSRTDGSETQVLDNGSYHSSLSPDGARLAYTGVVDELSILDLTTQQITNLSGTGMAFYQPHWSPNGMQIAFVRLLNDFDIFLISADGTGLQQLTQSTGSEELVGWLPDGEHLLYAIDGADGKSLYQLNVQSGEVQPLITGGEAARGDFAISLDGRRLAYVKTIIGDQRILYVSNLDGSAPQPIVDIYPALITNPVWGPAQDWLLIHVFDPEVSVLLATPVLINLESCQVIVLSNLPGEITSWIP